MGVVFYLVYVVIGFYLILLFARLAIGWIKVFARDWRPAGPMVVILEFVYSATDPPLNALRRLIPPLRLGSVQLDLGFMILVFALLILQGVAGSLSGL